MTAAVAKDGSYTPEPTDFQPHRPLASAWSDAGRAVFYNASSNSYANTISPSRSGILPAPGVRGRHTMVRIETQDRELSTLSAAEKELAPGEKLIWADRPRALALARREGPAFLMGIPFTAFALFWTWGASGAVGHAPDAFGVFFPLWRLIFIAIGLWILSTPLRAAMKAPSTIYAITSDRLLIIEGARSHRVTSFTPAAYSRSSARSALKVQAMLFSAARLRRCGAIPFHSTETGRPRGSDSSE